MKIPPQVRDAIDLDQRVKALAAERGVSVTAEMYRELVTNGAEAGEMPGTLKSPSYMCGNPVRHQNLPGWGAR